MTSMPAPSPPMAKILIVDDTPANLKLLVRVLAEEGYSVRPAKNGSVALSSIELELPDLVLLDIMMPGISGYDVCERLKDDERTRDIPVIFLSAKTDVLDKVKGFELGAADYIIKPFQSDEVLARVRAHLAIRCLQRELREQVQRFRTLADATFEGILIHEGGRILDVNKTLELLFASTRDELVGREVLELVCPELQEMVAERMASEEATPYHIEVFTKNAERIPVELQTQTLPYQGCEVHVTALRDLRHERALEQENAALKSGLKERFKFGEIIGRSSIMQRVYETIAGAAASEYNVIILGESGTGKELVARTIHALGARQEQPFVPVNCGAIAETLFEREFFGHRKGAFTGADRDTPGFFDAARQGTLFLDEVGELSLSMQVKLLRVLETGEYTPIGDTKSRQADIRLLAATNRDLEAHMEQGLMREDFFYRIHVIDIRVPPLRERREDIPLLIEFFLGRYALSPEKLPPHIFSALYSYEWPGNIRELQNKIQRYLATGCLELKSQIIGVDEPQAGPEDTLGQVGLFETVEQFEKQLILRTLEQHQGKRQVSADFLQITRRTLHKKMKKYGIS